MDTGGSVESLPEGELLRLKVGEAIGKIDKTVFPLKTYLADQHPDPIRAKEVIERSRMNYGITADGEPGTPRRQTRPVQPAVVHELPKDEEVFDPTKVF